MIEISFYKNHMPENSEQHPSLHELADDQETNNKARTLRKLLKNHDEFRYQLSDDGEMIFNCHDEQITFSFFPEATCIFPNGTKSFGSFYQSFDCYCGHEHLIPIYNATNARDVIKFMKVRSKHPHHCVLSQKQCRKITKLDGCDGFS